MINLQTLVDQAYETARSGAWDRILAQWADSPTLLRRCSRHAKPGSAWTFLHQAAYFGSEQACRALIRCGSPVDALSHDSRSPADIAEAQGHRELAVLLRDASTGKNPLWLPSSDPDVLPSSNRWSEASASTAPIALYVAYGGALVTIPKGTPHFVDSMDRVLVGWHGTFDPPRGMDGESLVASVAGSSAAPND